MAVRKLWITATPWPASDSVKSEAAASGADEILHGIPRELADQLAPGTTGYVELTVPDPTPAVDPIAALQAQVDQLTATLNALIGG